MALYRKYRPSSFAEVVGQEQVTRPLSVALDSGRINHAYLFSGPRGCGKTSSARILARSLNCVEGPTSTPCGRCNSCIALAPNGPGTLDVTELDAASNNGVEDMRELRDRAVYAPAESRYRIFIIDEAHMITTSGANALLKIVEEPPEHLIFIFATTEPEKVIGTIRSRTHHYPFRLLTPQAMRGLIERTVSQESAIVDESVYPLVIRAGGGSPRDTLSVLDQLLAGAGPEGLTYEHARQLLGATDDALLDATVTALSSDDKAGLFTTVDDVIEAGLDPRRFINDLLDRFRDLMILQAVPDAIQHGLVDAPVDRADILQAQAQAFPAGEVARLAALVNDGVSDIRGATSPRLLLEILCAKMLLPQAAAAVAPPRSNVVEPTRGVQPAVGTPASGPAANTPQPASANSGSGTRFERASVRRAREAAAAAAAASAAVAPTRSEEATDTVAPSRDQVSAPPREQMPEQPQQASVPVGPPRDEQQAAPAQSDDSFDTTIRAKWATIRETVFKLNTVTGIMLTEAKILGTRELRLVIGHNTGALAQRLNDPSNNQVIVQAIEQHLGVRAQVECIVGTDVERAGFSSPQPKPVWNPNTSSAATQQEDAPEPQGVASDDATPEDETREGVASDDATRQDATREDETREGEPREEETPEQPVGERPESQGVASDDATRADVAPADPWGEPVPLGGSTPEPVANQASTTANQGVSAESSAPASSPAQPATSQASPATRRPQAEEMPRWKQKAERGRRQLAAGTFADGTPLPPEPDDDYPPQEPPPVLDEAQARRVEEDEMIDAAQNEVGELDRRDALTVAMDLVTQELGGKRI